MIEIIQNKNQVKEIMYRGDIYMEGNSENTDQGGRDEG